MILAVFLLLAAMSSADAVAIVLNSRSATGMRTFESAQEMVEREARDGRPLQQFVIGVTTDDKTLAAKYLEVARAKICHLAEEGNDPLAWYLLSMEKNDLKLLKKAADGGNVQALNALGTIATQQAAVRKDIAADEREFVLAKSYGYFRQAALRRDPNGFVNLGTCHLRGLGCRRDEAMAFSCFKTAAELGHPEGMDNVSACYRFGLGVASDDEQSLLWTMRARALRGDAAAAQWLKERK